MQSCKRATRSSSPSKKLYLGCRVLRLNTAVGKYNKLFSWIHGCILISIIYRIDAVRITWSTVGTTTRLNRRRRFRPHRSRRACRFWPASKTVETWGWIELIFGSRWDNSPSMGCQGVPRASVCRPGILVFEKSPSNYPWLEIAKVKTGGAPVRPVPFRLFHLGWHRSSSVSPCTLPKLCQPASSWHHRGRATALGVHPGYPGPAFEAWSGWLVCHKSPSLLKCRIYLGWPCGPPSC